MPKRPPRPCSKHGWILINDGDECSECAKHPSPLRMRDSRPSASKRRYGSQHRRKRDALLRKHPWCADPFGRHEGQQVKAKIRDHIIPLGQGGKDDESNEQALCVPCHNIKIYRDGSR